MFYGGKRKLSKLCNESLLILRAFRTLQNMTLKYLHCFLMKSNRNCIFEDGNSTVSNKKIMSGSVHSNKASSKPHPSHGSF